MEAHPCQKALYLGVEIQGVTFPRFRCNLITSPIFLTLLGRRLSDGGGLARVGYSQLPDQMLSLILTRARIWSSVSNRHKS